MASSDLPLHASVSQRREIVSSSGRWGILKQAILNRPRELVYGNRSVSVRSFEGYSLFTRKFILSPLMHYWTTPPHSDIDRAPGRWYLFSSTQQEYSNLQIRVKLLTGAVSKRDMVGFDNTGNICIWPAEEVLAYHMLTIHTELQGTSICELGGGMTGFAGLVAALTQKPRRVLVSDGNELSVDNCRVVIAGNTDGFVDTQVRSDVIKWGEVACYEKYKGDFDFVIAADCLFFDTVHRELLSTISYLLGGGGRAILLAPNRGHTLTAFCELARELFVVEVSEKYNDIVWDKHVSSLAQYPNSYSSDLHYPIMINLHKR